MRSEALITKVTPKLRNNACILFSFFFGQTVLSNSKSVAEQHVANGSRSLKNRWMKILLRNISIEIVQGRSIVDRCLSESENAKTWCNFSLERSSLSKNLGTDCCILVERKENVLVKRIDRTIDRDRFKRIAQTKATWQQSGNRSKHFVNTEGMVRMPTSNVSVNVRGRIVLLLTIRTRVSRHLTAFMSNQVPHPPETRVALWADIAVHRR